MFVTNVSTSYRDHKWDKRCDVVRYTLIMVSYCNIQVNNGVLDFIIHLCDPTVVICYLIWPCDIAVRITFLISHSSSLSYNTVIKRYFQVGCIINTKLPSCVDIIHHTTLGFPSWCPESTRPTDSCFQGTSWKNLMMYGGLYQHTRVVLYIYFR